MEEMMNPNEIEIMRIQKENCELKKILDGLQRENDYMKKSLSEFEKLICKYEKTLKVINLLTENVGE